MFSDWDEDDNDRGVGREGDEAPKPPRKRHYRPARSYRVGAMQYESEVPGPTELLPYLKLRGRWLDTIGFEVGARLKVEATQDSITLTVVERPVPIPAKIPGKVQRAAREAARLAALAHPAKVSAAPPVQSAEVSAEPSSARRKA